MNPFLLIPIIALSSLPAYAENRLSTTDLKVEYKDRPIDVISQSPRFSWKLKTSNPATTQKSYRIWVKDSKGHVFWDSGTQESDKSVGISYNGEGLIPEERYHWEIEISDNHGNVVRNESDFTTAIKDWKGAEWIGGDPDSAPFHPQYFPVFAIAFDFKLTDKHGNASIIYGANDWRLSDNTKNPFRLTNGKDESYIEVNFANDSIKFLRHGYTPDDKHVSLIGTLAVPESVDFTTSHTIRINSVSGITGILIDDKNIGEINLNPMGRGGDFLAFPIVGDVGYDVPDNETASIENFRIESYRSPHNILASVGIGTVSGKKILTLSGNGATRIRKDFNISKQIKSAMLYTSARGIYDFYLNGELITTHMLNPGLSQYNRHHLFQTYDVTQYLKSGTNTAGVQLNEGWWSGASSFDPANWNWFGNRQSMICRLKIEYKDGSVDNIVSSEGDWKYSTDGAIRYGSLFQGEIYDARKDIREWTYPGYDDSSWNIAKRVVLDGVVTDGSIPGWPLADDYADFQLIPWNDAGITCHEIIGAKSMSQPQEGIYVYDMGQNCSAVPLITFRGLKEGQKITIRYAEVLYPDHERYRELSGYPMVENLRAAMAQDVYIASGDKEETYSPRSTYHGYRYIELSGIESPVDIKDVKSKVLSSIESFSSDFKTSDTTLNQLISNIRYSTLSNVFSIPTDCPQRNERMGWSGDVSVFAPAMTYLWDARSFLDRHTYALRDTQEDNGAYSPIAPQGGGFGGPLWQSAGITLPWQIYLMYDDINSLNQNYTAMKEYISMVLNNYIDDNDGHFKGTESWIDLGDWLGPQCNMNDKTLIFDSYLVYELDLMSKMANALGKIDDVRLFCTERDKRIEFINKSYVASDSSYLIGKGFGPQSHTWTGALGGLPDGYKIRAHTSYAVPLVLGVFDGMRKSNLAETLKKLVSSQSKGDDGKIYPAYSLMTGFIGTPWILYALSDNGHIKDAYSILRQDSYPSWLYPISLGATSVWERLNSMTKDDGFGQNNSMNSFNHYAFGCVYDWLMQRSAGLNPDPLSPGFKHFFLSPSIDPTGWLKNVSASYESMYGLIESSWETDGKKVTYIFNIPPNTHATVNLPGETFTLPSGKYSIVRAYDK